MKKLVIFVLFVIILSTFASATDYYYVTGKPDNNFPWKGSALCNQDGLCSCQESCEETGYTYTTGSWWDANKKACEQAGLQCPFLRSQGGCYLEEFSDDESYCRSIDNIQGIYKYGSKENEKSGCPWDCNSLSSYVQEVCWYAGKQCDYLREVYNGCSYDLKNKQCYPNSATPLINIKQGAAIARFAKQYLGCPYSFSSDSGRLSPTNCGKGLTCATFVQSVYYFSQYLDFHGDGISICNPDYGWNPFTEASYLEMGDVVSLKSSNQDYGHTAIYLGKGKISGGRFIKDNNGEHVFIHSTPAEVTLNSYSYFFSQGSDYSLNTYCRIHYFT